MPGCFFFSILDLSLVDEGKIGLPPEISETLSLKKKNPPPKQPSGKMGMGSSVNVGVDAKLNNQFLQIDL